MPKRHETDAVLLTNQQGQHSGMSSPQSVIFVSAKGSSIPFASLRDAGRFLRTVGIVDPSAN